MDYDLSLIENKMQWILLFDKIINKKKCQPYRLIFVFDETNVSINNNNNSNDNNNDQILKLAVYLKKNAVSNEYTSEDLLDLSLETMEDLSIFGYAISIHRLGFEIFICCHFFFVFIFYFFVFFIFLFFFISF